MIDQASLIVGDGNWAVKSDSLLGYKIINKKYYPREMSVTRATTATRVNEDGLIEVVPYNLLRYSEQFEDGVWTKITTSVTANTTTAPNGTLTADSLIPNAVTFGLIQQTANITANVPNTFSVYAKYNGISIFQLQTRDNANNANVAIVNFDILTGVVLMAPSASGAYSNASATIESVGNGWYRLSLTSTSNISVTSRFRLVSDLSDGINGYFIWGAQLVEGSAPKDYLPTTDRLNVPRIDYSNGGCPSILVEPQRTNLALRSQEFENASWTKFNVTASTNSLIAPDGTLTADKLVEGATDSVHWTFQLNTGSYQSLTASCYFKKSEREWGLIRMRTTSGDQYAYFNLTTGTLGNVDAQLTASIQDVGNGWFRCIVVTLFPTTATNPIVFGMSTADNVFSYLGNGTSGIFIWGAQLEAGAYATSYIPTVASAVTRNADVISKTGISDLIGQSEGTFYLELKEAADGTDKMIQLSDGSDNNNINIQFINNTIRLTTFGGGAGYRVISIPSNVFQNNKIVFSWKAGNIFGYVNGVKYTLTLFNGSGDGIPTTLNRIDLRFWWTGQPFFGNINQILVFKKQLTDAECIALTTL